MSVRFRLKDRVIDPYFYSPVYLNFDLVCTNFNCEVYDSAILNKQGVAMFYIMCTQPCTEGPGNMLP